VKDRYVFTAVLHFDDDGISIEYPDLPGCISCADTVAEAKANALEALELHLYCSEKYGDEIPEPTNYFEWDLKDNEIPLMVEVFMPAVRKEMETQKDKGFAEVV